MDFEIIWNNIQLFEGEIFKTIRGVQYRYVVYDNYILINDDKRRKIKMDSLKEAIAIVNPSPSKIQRSNIWGPSYVYGIITDKRIVGLNN